MNSPARDIVDILDGESSLGLIKGTDLFYNRMAGTKADIVVVYDIPGNAPLLTLQKSTSDYFFPGVSIQVRDVDHDTAYSTADSIRNFLHGLSATTINSTLYMLVKAIDDIQLMKYDENDRPVLVMNFETQRRAA